MIPATVMMALGAFRFGMLGPDYQKSLQTSTYRWHELQRQGRSPALQYAGPGADSVMLEGVIYPHFKGGLRQIDAMRLIAGTGAPLMMVDSLGFIWRRWVITDIEERKSTFLPDGAAMKIEFGITLKQYGEDALGGVA